MELWWQSLVLEQQIFYGIGIISLFSLVLQMILLVFAGMDDHSDFSSTGDHSSGLGVLSFRGITAFFLGFGWAGVIALKAGLGLGAAIAIGLGAGGILMVGIFLLMTTIMKLQSSGSLDYANAIGEIATVYVTVPAGHKAGGQVEVMIQGRLSVAEALQKGDTPLAPGTKVKVVEKIGQSTFVVEPLHV